MIGCSDFRVRLAQEGDTASVLKLVSCLQLKGNTMRDFQQYNAARRDDVSPPSLPSHTQSRSYRAREALKK